MDQHESVTVLLHRVYGLQRVVIRDSIQNQDNGFIVNRTCACVLFEEQGIHVVQSFVQVERRGFCDGREGTGDIVVIGESVQQLVLVVTDIAPTQADAGPLARGDNRNATVGLSVVKLEI